MIKNRSKIGTKIDQKWVVESMPQKAPKILSKSFQNPSKIRPKSSQNGFRNDVPTDDEKVRGWVHAGHATHAERRVGRPYKEMILHPLAGPIQKFNHSTSCHKGMVADIIFQYVISIVLYYFRFTIYYSIFEYLMLFIMLDYNILYFYIILSYILLYYIISHFC